MSAEGEVLWARTWGTELDDSFASLAMGPDGCVYVVGNSWSIDTYVSTGIVARFNLDGDLLASAPLDGSEFDSFSGVAVSEEHGLVIIGSAGEHRIPHAVMLRLTPALDVLSGLTWVAENEGESNAVSCALDEEGHLYIAGKALAAAGTWEEIQYVPASLGLEAHSVEGGEWDLEGVAHEPEGTVTEPGFVIDQGGGGYDLLLMKSYPM